MVGVRMRRQNRDHLAPEFLAHRLDRLFPTRIVQSRVDEDTTTTLSSQYPHVDPSRNHRDPLRQLLNRHLSHPLSPPNSEHAMPTTILPGEEARVVWSCAKGEGERSGSTHRRGRAVRSSRTRATLRADRSSAKSATDSHAIGREDPGHHLLRTINPYPPQLRIGDVAPR